MSTRIRCETPSWLWPVWSLAFDGNDPVKGFTHAREPIRSWSPLRPETYGSEHPGHRCVPVWQPDVLHVAQTLSSNASNVCFIHDCPICSNRSVLSAPPLMR